VNYGILICHNDTNIYSDGWEGKMVSSIVFGQNESAILRRLTEQGSPKLITTKDAADYVGQHVSANSLTHTLSFLSAKGVLERVGKGLYLNRSNGLSPKITEVIPWVFGEVRYYVGLNAAANFWGLTPQIPSVYHVVYVPTNEAVSRRIERWCLMLSSKEQLGGELRPIKSKVMTIVEDGITQKVIDEMQLPVSTVEATLIDGITHPDEIGGADEILHWVKTALGANLTSPDQLTRLTRSVSNELGSTNAWTGFLLEYMLNAGLVTDAKKPEVKRLIDDAYQRLDRHPTYRWGKKSTNSEYFNTWRLHVGKTYVDQLNSAATFE
jgi:predicted transcriptional regulator of viral defense system